ncbi:MAG: hypothetical protein HYR67_14250 [Bacteroidetes bacterium]|nr:hypothetical protein [Bacteroidota bacterium]
MATFNKSDLHYQDYSWSTTEGDSSKIRGFPDNILLNRHEGYEVQYFINRFIEGQTSWQDLAIQQKKDLGRKIERMIHDHLPGDIRSQEKIHQWVVSRWSTLT